MLRVSRMIKPVPHIAAMAPYALASLSVPPDKVLISLSQNESLRPASPRAVAAGAAALADAQLYPDPDWTALRRALAQRYELSEGNILCGSGSMELIACLALAYADANNAVLAPEHAYPYFRTAASLSQARFDTAPEDNLHVSVDALLAACQPDTSLVFVANPANPTGTRIPRADLYRLRKGLPARVLLVIDEAYGEFADHLNEPCFDLVSRGDTVVLRTLSKAYGLAGARVGWGVIPQDIATQLRKVMAPNNISAASQAAAVAALEDYSYMRETCTQTARLRAGFVNNLSAAGFDVLPSFTNFVLLRFADTATARSADSALRAQGIVARAQSGVGLGNCLRITVGTAEALDAAAICLQDWKGSMT